MKRILCFIAIFAAVPASWAWATASEDIRIQIVDQRGMPVRDAVVELAGDRTHSGPIRFPWRMAVAQRNETFVPGTLIVPKGSTVAFPKRDRVRHSIYSFSKPARFEIELYGRDQTRSQNFPASGTVSIGCKIHDNMRGYLRVVETPFAGKTDANGYVTLSGVPTGNVSATVWHPSLRGPNNERNGFLSIKPSQNVQRVTVTLR